MKKEKNGMITVTFATGEKRSVPRGTALLKLAGEFKDRHPALIVAAKVDNDIKELSYNLDSDSQVEFIDLTHTDGFRIYQRSACFILIKAVYDLFPDRKVVVHHSISKGLYCEIKGEKKLEQDEVDRIEKRMREIVDAAIPFLKRTVSSKEAEKLFTDAGRMDRYHAVEHRLKPYVTVYSCDGLEDYFYGYMTPDTSYVKWFALKYYPPGLILQYPERSHPGIIPEFEEQRKLFSVFAEYKNWNRILGVENVGALNDIVKSGQINDFIRISEALHEKKIAQIADRVAAMGQTDADHGFVRPTRKVILISGPSSSGKTTFSHRLAIQLRVNGLNPVTIALDDYFLDREKTPLDEEGEYDFEALEAIDIQLFNRHLDSLIHGQEVDVPIFDFEKGCRDSRCRRLRMEEKQILVVEGLHGLNPALTRSIPAENKFKIYVSALTSMNIDDHNRIPTTDTRLVRRIVRDHLFRGCGALETIRRWPSVRRGEKRNIFPYQEEADVLFNSSLIFELGVLKTFAEPLLSAIDRSCPEYSEAKRLLEFLSYFLPIDPGEIPKNSIIREFIGESCFFGK